MTQNVYLEELNKIFEVAEFLRKDNPSSALRFYYNFYMSLTGDYTEINKLANNKEIYEFIKMIDMTEIYYNFAKLHSSMGNVDDTVYFVSLALCEMLNIHPRTLQTWDRDGKIKIHRTPTNRRHVPESEI